MKFFVTVSILICSVVGQIWVTPPVQAQRVDDGETPPPAFQVVKPRAPQPPAAGVKLFFQKLGQKVNLAFTFDAIKEVKKRVTYAQEYMMQAESIMLRGGSVHEALALMANAEDLISGAKADIDTLKTSADPVATGLLRDLEIHLAYVEELLKKVYAQLEQDSDTEAKTAYSRVADGYNGIAGVLNATGNGLGTAAAALKQKRLDRINQDQDRDGILDEVESTQMQTSVQDFDTDGDGLSDRAEVEFFNTDPTNPDTDDDGFWDGLEITKGYNPLGPGKLTQ